MTAAIQIVAADRTGIPVQAVCPGCGEVWDRPGRDPAATTLPFFAWAHDGCAQPEGAA